MHVRMTALQDVTAALLTRCSALAADCVLHSNGQAISFGSNDPALAASLQKLFEPYVVVTDTQTSSFVVRVVIDRALAACLSELFFNAVDGPLESVARITDDIDVVCHRVLASGHPCLWHIVVKGQRLVYSVTGALSEQTAYEVFRTVRIMFHILFLEAGLLPVHAAAVTTEGRALCFLGDKYAGKTTLALECVERLGWSYLSNDKSYLNLQRGERAVSALPVRAGIRWDIVDRVSVLQRLACNCDRSLIANDRLYCSPREIADLFKVDLKPSATVAAFIYLSREPEYSAARLRAIEYKKSKQILEANYTPLDMFDEHPYWRHILNEQSICGLKGHLYSTKNDSEYLPPSFVLEYSGGIDNRFAILEEIMGLSNISEWESVE